MLNRIGHSLGLPSGPKPQTWLGLTSSGKPPPQLDGGGSICAGSPLGRLPGGIIVVDAAVSAGLGPEPVFDPFQAGPADHGGPLDHDRLTGREAALARGRRCRLPSSSTTRGRCSAGRRCHWPCSRW